jgi:hypothetical protein
MSEPFGVLLDGKRRGLAFAELSEHDREAVRAFAEEVRAMNKDTEKSAAAAAVEVNRELAEDEPRPETETPVRRRRGREVRSFEIVTADEELQRLYIFLTLFDEMDGPERERVLGYLLSRFPRGTF